MCSKMSFGIESLSRLPFQRSQNQSSHHKMASILKSRRISIRRGNYLPERLALQLRFLRFRAQKLGNLLIKLQRVYDIANFAAIQNNDNISSFYILLAQYPVNCTER